MKSALKALIILAIGGITLSVVSLVIWIKVNRDMSGLVFGRIMSVSPTTIDIVDRNNTRTVILIGTGTTITNKAVPVDFQMITVGLFAQVHGVRLDKDTIAADTVRLMRYTSPK